MQTTLHDLDRKRIVGIMSNLSHRILSIREQISEASDRSNREPRDITLMAASKTVNPDTILEAIDLGITTFGENQIQEAEWKFSQRPELASRATWHFIGSLQSNKAKRALSLFTTVQSVDRLSIANRLNTIANDLDIRLSVYIEVNVGGEANKSGCSPTQLPMLASSISQFANLEIIGLMTVAPAAQNQEDVRPIFRNLRIIRDQIQDTILPSNQLGLSMGMSSDYKVAIEEGSTLVRIGTSLWGPRKD